MSTRSMLKRSLLLGIVFLLLAALPALISAATRPRPASAAPSFVARVEQPAGAPWTLVHVKGDGFTAEASGTIVLRSVARPGRGVSQLPRSWRFEHALSTSTDGALTAAIRLPRLSRGTYELRMIVKGKVTESQLVVRGGGAAALAAPPSAALAVSPASGTPGDRVVVTGTGFPARRKGSLAFGGSTGGMPGVRTATDGSFRVTITVPAAGTGGTSLTAAIAAVSASVPFSVGLAPQPTPTSTPSATPTPTSTPSATPSPTVTPSVTPTPSPTATPAPSGRKVVAYFPIWNLNEGYTWRNVDFSAITHIGHFSVVPRTDGSVEIPDWGPFPDADLLREAHNAGVKVYLVVGGDHAASTQGFAAMAASGSTRERFVRELMAIVDAQGYDGVELDWEFPYNSTDRSNLTLLVRDLRSALGNARTLSVAMPGSNWYGQWYDVAALEPNLSWFSVMTYSFAAASWADTATHNSPLYGSGSIDSARQYYMGRGVPARKFLAGIPFFGERFDGAEGLNDPLSNRTGGALEYRAIAPLIGNGWSEGRDMAAGEMPYLLKDGGAGVIVYDDPQSIRAKCRYVIDQAIGGVMVWRLGQDVVAGAQPLFRAVSNCK